MAHLPLVSIITPSYNRSRFIRETVVSVLQQDYPFIEHIVVDGGSTDGTVEILQQYSQHGDRFRYVSEPDRGQSHAINKGLAMSRGEIIGWLNSDDTYLPGAIRKAVRALLQHPHWAMVHGLAYVTDERSQRRSAYSVEPVDYQKLFHGCRICQPTAFIRKDVFQQLGGVDESLHFCMDYDLWIRIAKRHTIGFLDEYLATARVHPSAKSVTHWKSIGLPEILQTISKHYGTVSNDWLQLFLSQHADKDIFWLLNRFKDYSVFGIPPKISNINRYADFWVPARLVMTVEADPGFPLHALLLKGRVPLSAFPSAHRNKYRLTVLLNRKITGTFFIDQESFTLEVPLHTSQSSNHIEMMSSHFIPSGHPLNPHQTPLSFLADDVIPLSRKEAEFYRVYQRSPYLAAAWIWQNRQPVPCPPSLQENPFRSGTGSTHDGEDTG